MAQETLTVETTTRITTSDGTVLAEETTSTDISVDTQETINISEVATDGGYGTDFTDREATGGD